LPPRILSLVQIYGVPRGRWRRARGVRSTTTWRSPNRSPARHWRIEIVSVSV